LARPSLFVGSSSEGLRIARAVQAELDADCEVKLWTQGTFGLGQGSLESLVLALPEYDFALLVLTADDLTTSRGTTTPSARDNVLFELGLFTGALGRQRVFMLYDATAPPSLPSDLAGIAAATYRPHEDGNLTAALGAPCTQIRNLVERLGPRPERELRKLEAATATVEDVGDRMQRVVDRLGESRTLELAIFTRYFRGALMKEDAEALERDLAELRKVLGKEQAAGPGGSSGPN
jgi:hypothetical protein